MSMEKKNEKQKATKFSTYDDDSVFFSFFSVMYDDIMTYTIVRKMCLVNNQPTS